MQVVALHLAAIGGHLQVAEALITHSKDLLSKKNRQNLTPLHYVFYFTLWPSTESTRSEMAALLLKHGAKVDQIDEEGHTPLFLSVHIGDEESTELLITRGANVNHANKRGATPLGSAVDSRQQAILKKLLDNGANPNQADKQGVTILMQAALCGQTDVVTLLLDRGAKINQANKDGNTALHIAILREQRETAELLVERGADIHIKNKAGKSPLELIEAPAFKAQIQGLFDAYTAEVKREKAARNQHRWNFFISFLVGLTIVYPLAKTIQYFWKLRGIHNEEIAKEAQPKQADTSANKSKSILGSIGKEYKSWAIYYEYGLEKKLGVRHTAAEIQQAIPECYRKALRLNLA